MRADLDIDLVRCFTAVADTGGFSSAGRLLGRTQSAVSMKIKRLEEILESRLLDRDRRSTHLTAEGERFLSYAHRLLDLHDEALRVMLHPDAEGSLKLGVISYFLPQKLPELLARFARAYPKVRLEVHSGLSRNLMPMYESGELDLVIAHKRWPAAGRTLYREPILWAAHGDYRPQLDQPVPLVTYAYNTLFHEWAEEALHHAGKTYRVAYTGAGMMVLIEVVRAGLGVTMLPKSVIPEDLRILGPESGFPELPIMEVALYGEERMETPLARHLSAFFLDTLQSMGLMEQKP
ncbi:LysR substrate-binding domain-containing protein [Magnetococcus sp. PR-3]|uniref:LysR substrate-binding domain-containing protein n=1 Tax=Magnetococcus sp. PR-3 TaxID=3120355 RepID=UPI002FCE4C50